MERAAIRGRILSEKPGRRSRLATKPGMRGQSAPYPHYSLIGKLALKKTYQLRIEGKNPDRLLEAIKFEIRKYIKREQGKALPKGFDIWDFDCHIGADEATAQVTHPAEINPAIDDVVKTGVTSFYIALTAKAAQRRPRQAPTLIPRNGGEADDALDD